MTPTSPLHDWLCRLAQGGRRDLRDLGIPHERAGIDVANRVEAKLYGALEALAQNPRLGHERSDLTSHPVLFFTVYSYMIVYRPGTPLDIARVLHGKRDLKRILGNP